MINRRGFVQGTAAAFAVSSSGSVRGANERVRMALIGTGGRGMQVHGGFARHSDNVFVAACDVAGKRLSEAAATIGGKVETTGDYRRILDRKDVDAVLIATPDHWHGPIMVDACNAGKDVYVEKPVSNTLEAALAMREASKRTGRVVQVGLQQRSWPRFQECARMVREGLLGPVTHVLMSQGFIGPLTVDEPQPPPADLDWETWQGPARRHPYSPARQNYWRDFYDYGGGLVTDWGVHLVDVAHWFISGDTKAPKLTSAAAQYVLTDRPDRELVPNAFVVTWQYDNLVMSFTSAVLPQNDSVEWWGNTFFGPRGSLLVNRAGYQIRPFPSDPYRQRDREKAKRGDKAEASASHPEPPIEARTRFLKNWVPEERDADAAHVRNFLDCVKSRGKPACNFETGFHSSLPCLLGRMAVREGKSIAWDGQAARAV